MRYIIFSIFFLLHGCSVKDYTLFEDDNPKHTNDIQDLDIKYKAKILVDDILIIDIYNMNQKLTNLVPTSSSDTSFINEYIVSEEGEIHLPLLGEVKVLGLTKKELNHLLIKKYQKYLTQPYIKSKVKNHKVYVMGEVSTQGSIPIHGTSISILDIITQSGGLSDHAVRTNVRIIFEKEGKFKIRTLDLTKLSTLNTHNLMVRHNSIVYVPPKRTKAMKVNLDDYAPFISLIGTVLGTFLTIDYLQGS